MRFKTNRLVVADWQPELSGASRAALDAAFAQILTPAVLAPLPPAAQSLDQGVAGWIDRQALLAQGLTIRLRDAGRIIGLALVISPSSDDVHIGYLLAEDVWGQGLASELVPGLVEALKKRGETRVNAGVAVNNPASARVLLKAGFRQMPAPDGADVLRFQMDFKAPS